MPRIVVVCGYGCHLNAQLKIYLDRVCRYVNENQIDQLILCGGATQRKTAKGKTEARVMLKYLAGNLDIKKSLTCPCSLEEDSYTTLENISGASQIIKTAYPYDDLEFTGPLADREVVIFCEASRALKILWLAKCFMPYYTVRVETASWEQMHPIKQFLSTLYECAALYVPFLAMLFRNQRIRLSESR